MARLINNLVDNAIRYAPAGSQVEVTVAPGGLGAVVEVVDQGPGFESDFQLVALTASPPTILHATLVPAWGWRLRSRLSMPTLEKSPFGLAPGE